MGAIIGMNKKQDAIYSGVLAQDVVIQDALLELAQVLPVVGGVYSFRKVADALVDLSQQTAGDAFEISSVLSLVKASQFGDVLSPDRIPVQVDDEKRGWDNMSDEEGFLLRQGRNLSLYVIGRAETYTLVSEAGCKLWSTSPEELAECIGEVFLSISADGTTDTRGYAGELSLDACEDIAEFKAGVSNE